MGCFTTKYYFAGLRIMSIRFFPNSLDKWASRCFALIVIPAFAITKYGKHGLGDLSQLERFTEDGFYGSSVNLPAGHDS